MTNKGNEYELFFPKDSNITIYIMNEKGKTIERYIPA